MEDKKKLCDCYDYVQRQQLSFVRSLMSEPQRPGYLDRAEQGLDVVESFNMTLSYNDCIGYEEREKRYEEIEKLRKRIEELRTEG